MVHCTLMFQLQKNYYQYIINYLLTNYILDYFSLHSHNCSSGYCILLSLLMQLINYAQKNSQNMDKSYSLGQILRNVKNQVLILLISTKVKYFCIQGYPGPILVNLFRSKLRTIYSVNTNVYSYVPLND